VNRGAFHRPRLRALGSLRLLVTRVGLSLTPPTRYPQGWGQGAFEGIASVARGVHPRVT
jgi:hypothetical protein